MDKGGDESLLNVNANTKVQECDCDRLPDVLWNLILSHLAPKDLSSISIVDKHFYSLSNQDSLWKILCGRRWEGKQSIPCRRSNSNHAAFSWKERYAWAEFDKYRSVLSRTELCHEFHWKLIYNGKESRLGLRKFDANGTFTSPYAGVVQWTFFENKLCFMGVLFPIERNPENWGWIIGRGSPTEYHSVEQRHVG